MPRTEITVNTTSRTGLDSSAMMAAADSANGMYMDNNGQKNIVYVKNGSGVSIDVTFITTTVIDGISLPDLVITIAAGAERMVGPFSNTYYGSGTGSQVYIDFSASASVTVAGLQIGNI